MSTSFLLIRHAQSEWNAQGRWQGQADPPLSKRGLSQAEALAQRLAESRLRADRLLSSDLQRALRTAEIVGRALGLEHEPMPVLRELDVGAWSGLTRAEIAARDPELLARFEAGDARVRAGGGESRAEIRARVLRTFAELERKHPEQTLVVVTHLGVARALVPGTDLAHTELLRVASSGFRVLD